MFSSATKFFLTSKTIIGSLVTAGSSAAPLLQTEPLYAIPIFGGLVLTIYGRFSADRGLSLGLNLGEK